MLKRKKWLAAGLLAVFFITTAESCGGGDNKVNETAEKDRKNSAETYSKLKKSQPDPSPDYSQIRQGLIDVEMAQAEGVQTTTFSFLEGIGLVDWCPSIGLPIPSTSQLSNPYQVVSAPHKSSAVIGMPEPTGIFTGQSSGTYVQCVGADGEIVVNYWEGYVKSVTGPAHYDEELKRVVMDGASSYNFKTKKDK